MTIQYLSLILKCNYYIFEYYLLLNIIDLKYYLWSYNIYCHKIRLFYDQILFIDSAKIILCNYLQLSAII